LRRSRSRAAPLRSTRNSKIDLLTLKEEPEETKYAVQRYKVFFSVKLARKYEPIIYSSECMSGDPEALYYRILQRNGNKDNESELCIQYFYYWQDQRCMMTSHGHDYEPIFIYLKKKSGDSNPHLIVNGGLGGPDCYFHKNEVRPLHGKRDGKTQHVTANLSAYPSYPFGQDGNIQYHACISTYPLDTGKDLQFEGEYHALFGIRACSNVFSGAQGDLHGRRFSPPLKKLTDRVLDKWYFHHYENMDDMPFGHDIADPFSSPYIKFHKPSKEEVDTLGKQIR
jgi:hypothetical protein